MPRKAQNEAWGMVWAAHASQEWGGKDLGRCRKGQANIAKGFGCFMIPKSGAGRIWRRFNAYLNNFLLLRPVGKRNLALDLGLPRSELAGAQEGSNEACGGVWATHGSQEWGGKCFGLGWFGKGQTEP